MIGKIISHYKILKKLGQGGMGIVYKAEDTKLKRTVALKFLPPNMTRDEEAKQRFIQEAQAVSALQHQNICTIHDIDETPDGQVFMVMDYYEGETLKEAVGSRQLAVDRLIEIALQIAEGLKEAHEKSMVHRDIKPANIMITEKGQIKIMDFGLAKLTGQAHLTQHGSTLGTASYMSPEQVRGEKVDARTDIWSLGVVIFEMITGGLPFKGEYEQAVLYSILNEEPESMTKIRGDIPAELQRLVHMSLQKEPGKRYQKSDELLKELYSLQKKIETERVRAHANKDKVKPSIAILPFVNMSPDPVNDYFGDGLAEELINALAKLDGIHIVARTSSFCFHGKDIDIRQVGEQLRVSTVLEGSVRKSENRLRITAQLINVADGYHLWSEKYDRELGDVFDIQDEISLAIVDALKVKLLGTEKEKLVKRCTDNLEAYDLYLHGRYHLNRFNEEGLKKALDYFRLAIQKDSGYSLAYVGVAGVHFMFGAIGQFMSNKKRTLAKSELLKALELDDSCAEAHAWLGLFYYVYEWDWASAEREIKRAIELKPNSSEAHFFYSDYLTAMGQFTEAMAEVEQSRELDPLSNLPKTLFIYQLYATRQFERAIKYCRKTLEMETLFLIQLHLWRSLYWLNRLEEAWVECKKFFTIFISREIADEMESSYIKAGFNGALRVATEKLTEMSKTQYVVPVLIATLFSYSENDDQTLDWLERAYEERNQLVYAIGVEPDYERLHSNPRFVALLKKIGIEK